MEEIKLNIKVVKAQTFWQRFIGLMFKKNIKYSVLFKNCKSVHTFFMCFNLDVIFLDRDNRVIKIVKQLKPFRIVLPVKNAVSIIEIPSNTIENVNSIIGKKLIDF
ncbi:MAG: DUF192 domain-containing protein [Endomicrobium sp.]|jgi:uncharacterized membrane protein (UPF0127 family)|nr:DUF192 domain-containing protein [Endomicrobium sp.]MDR2399506.1 DUF192 domain-containing protein [Endomicrobium sp.]